MRNAVLATVTLGVLFVASRTVEQYRSRLKETDSPPLACPTPVAPAPSPRPVVPRPRPRPKPSPWGKLAEAAVGGPQRNGQRIQCDLPGHLHRKNTSSRGLGNCVFTSIHHSALWQNVPELEEFPRWLTGKGIPGGGYPQKVDDLIPRMCRDRGVPVPHYLQIEGVDLSLLRQACESGRMPGVTYSFSPAGRYGGQRIAHMVNLVNADPSGWVILDNNYPGEDRYEWLTEEEFRQTYTGGRSGWAVILLAPPPPPRPIEKDEVD